MIEFSFIIPVRNGGSYLLKCIKSILDQNDRDFDIVILDNNSSDNSIDLIKKLNNDKISIYSSEKDLSIEENWERVLSVKKNLFFTISGHDDYFYPNYLANIKETIINYPGYSIYQTNFNIVDEYGKIIKNSNYKNQFLNWSDFFNLRIDHNLESFGTGYVFNKFEYFSVGGIPLYKDLMFSDDSLIFKILKFRNSKIAIHNEISFAYRRHEKSTSYNNLNLILALSEYIKDLGESHLIQNINNLKFIAFIVNHVQYVYFRNKKYKSLESEIGLLKNVSKIYFNDLEYILFSESLHKSINSPFSSVNFLFKRVLNFLNKTIAKI